MFPRCEDKNFFLTPGMQGLSSLIGDQNLAPLQWKHGVLTTGLPGKSPEGKGLTTGSLKTERQIKKL